ncbi:hypothetical protein KCP73_12315 [Salmonella enterica subsp. enterica]|nr:hypothetical protein KCP73_12315 [Salmonella enterica subsp. enterica]
MTVLADTAIRGQDAAKREPRKRSVKPKHIKSSHLTSVTSGVCGTGPKRSLNCALSS